MVRQVFTGSMIHADEKEEVTFKEIVVILVEDGKVLNVFHILLLLCLCFINNLSNIDKI